VTCVTVTKIRDIHSVVAGAQACSSGCSLISVLQDSGNELVALAIVLYVVYLQVLALHLLLKAFITQWDSYYRLGNETVSIILHLAL